MNPDVVIPEPLLLLSPTNGPDTPSFFRLSRTPPSRLVAHPPIPPLLYALALSLRRHNSKTTPLKDGAPLSPFSLFSEEKREQFRYGDVRAAQPAKCHQYPDIYLYIGGIENHFYPCSTPSRAALGQQACGTRRRRSRNSAAAAGGPFPICLLHFGFRAARGPRHL